MIWELLDKGGFVMSRFTYSNDELDMNKILKMNLDDSQSMLVDESISQSRRNADSSIEASLALLRSLGKHEDVAKLSADVGAKEKIGNQSIVLF